jgi:hypothetical protein
VVGAGESSASRASTFKIRRVSGNLARVEPTLSLASWEDAERLFRSRREALVPVAEPMILVSQVQRSGGTLVNTLLDGHPELHVHPYELHVGHPTKADWPVLDLTADPDTWLEVLSEPRIDRLFQLGYQKGGREDAAEHLSLPFTVVPSFLEHLFRLLCAERPVRSQRDIFDIYLTAFFNSWFDNQGLRDGPKRWVTGFAPRVAWGDSRRRFFDAYPDGRVVSCLRDPRAWYASASPFSKRYGDFDEALALWRRGATEMAAAKREAPDKVFVLTYEALVSDPRRVMGALADWLGISWHPILLQPTFNRLATEPNSSHGVQGTGVRRESLDAWTRALSAEVVSNIEAELLELDAEVRELADMA